MKAKHAFLLIAVGFALGFAGAIFKILHLGAADPVLWAAIILQVLGMLALAGKGLRYEGFRKFLQR